MSDAEAAELPDPPKPPRSGPPKLAVGLFLLTVVTTLQQGAEFAVGTGFVPEYDSVLGWLRAGTPYAATLLGILVAHEMGHFVAAKLHGVSAGWPVFIPVPFGVGTFGAIIRMSGRIPHRAALIDIGAAGPLAGAVVALPLLVLGVSLSRIVEQPVEANVFFGNLSALSLLEWAWTGVEPWTLGLTMEPQPLVYVLYKKLVLGLTATQDVQVHPVAYAALIGLYVTALNLVPIGQLDGGHVAYAALGTRAEQVGRVSLILLVCLMLVSSVGWALWALLAWRFVGVGHPPVLDPARPLGLRGRLVLVATILLFVLTLTPVSVDIL